MRVYVAGPYTNGDVAVNVKVAMEAGLALIKLGHVPFIPHLSHFLHMHDPQPYETWMKLDIEWIGQCDALLRLPGHSPGADREVGHAQRIGVKVFNSIEAIGE